MAHLRFLESQGVENPLLIDHKTRIYSVQASLINSNFFPVSEVERKFLLHCLPEFDLILSLVL